MMALPPIDNWGLWDVEHIQVKFISKRWAQISCEHKSINGETRFINVLLMPWDWLRGINFEQKFSRKLFKFAKKMTRKNERIIDLRNKGKAAEEALQNQLGKSNLNYSKNYSERGNTQCKSL